MKAELSTNIINNLITSQGAVVVNNYHTNENILKQVRPNSFLLSL